MAKLYRGYEDEGCAVEAALRDYYSQVEDADAAYDACDQVQCLGCDAEFEKPEDGQGIELDYCMHGDHRLLGWCDECSGEES